ncbi:Cytochrome c biogenesis protein ResB [Mariprofundus ferrinatatus]|uniref:Cytochrome c biogenesis protein ResB n=1 Tax=Mariprofundus ferrinatatus TaxID=1921087 RepID=A0A2K8L107_9PROT|nr:cytochrome c biogenesis protein ResB [Mariprofundus ferrinatatus]ATX80923.1 Cytochrome c biogenesis protein ResB [Mariprofundus ferrinatatus]
MNSFSDFLKLLWQRLGSMSLAIVLLMVLSIASVIGTVLLQNQQQTDYLQQFGPLWYWVFRSLGLFDMYHTWWFLTLLAFLMLSLTACLWRNVPKMLKEMRSRKVTINDRSLGRMELLQQWQLKADTSVDQLQQTFQKHLHGWEFKTQEESGVHYVRADKGRRHKWGYISVHAAILVILVGGWISVQFGFRGNMSVAEGAVEQEIFFLKGTATETLDMPFQVRCNSFEIDFFPTGAPKEFRSNLTIIDEGKEVLTSDIIVNEPLFYKGVYIYQASFGDGGSDVYFKLYHMNGSEETSFVKTKVYNTWKDEESGISLEVTDFRPYNVENVAHEGQPRKFKDIGPSVEFVFRGPGIKPVKVKAYMNPYIDGDGHNQGSWLMVSLSGDTKDYQPVALGLDFTNQDEWRLFNAFGRNLSRLSGEQNEKENFQAFKDAMKEVYGDNPPENVQNIAMRAVQAMNLIPQLPWPVIPMLEDFEHVYYTGLQLAKDPGMNVVWAGSAILVIGLCIMFYVPHRKLWLVIRQNGDATEVQLAGNTNRNMMSFKQTFHDLFTKLDEDFRTN